MAEYHQSHELLNPPGTIEVKCVNCGLLNDYYGHKKLSQPCPHKDGSTSMTPKEVRSLLDEMSQDSDGDVRLMASAIKSYTDGCPDNEVVEQTKTVADTFIDVLKELRNKL